jgi:hypothetical protein
MVRFSVFQGRGLTSEDAESAEEEGRGEENEEEITTETRGKKKRGRSQPLTHLFNLLRVLCDLCGRCFWFCSWYCAKED